MERRRSESREVWEMRISMTDPNGKAVDKIDAWFLRQNSFVPLLKICSDGMAAWLELAGLSASNVERVDAVLVNDCA